MRFALSVASVLLLGSAAFAEEASAPPPAAPPAAAPAPAPAPAAKKLPLRVVRVLEDTQQALLFDKAKGTHVLVETGKQIDGFTVTDIDEDSVTLTAEGGQQIVLAGPDPSWRGHERHGAQKAKAAAVTTTGATPASATPEDPYASAAPMDPYGDDDVRSAEAPGAAPTTATPTTAPIAAGEGGVRTAEAPAVAAPSEGIRSAEAPSTAANVVVSAAIPMAAAPIVSAAAPVAEPVAAPSAEPPVPMDTSSSAAWSTTPVDPETAAIVGLLTDKPDATATKTAKAPATKATPKTGTAKTDKAIATKIPSVSAAAGPAATATAVAPADGATLIAKADVTAALGNFSALASSVRGSFSAGGAHLDAVAPDSLFAKAGLQAGDTVTAINNQPLRSLDDAATLYARAGSMRAATIQIVRAGKPLSLRLAIQ